MLVGFVFFSVFVFFGAPLTAYSQDNNIEINLDALENYTPPPLMFPSTEETEGSAKKPNLLDKRIKVPAPHRKPIYKGKSFDQPETQLDEDALALKTAKDILRSIEGDVPTVVEAPPLSHSPLPEQDLTREHRLKNLSEMEKDTFFEVILPFTTQRETLSETQKQIVLQQVLIRLQKYEDAHLEVRSYAATSDAQSSPSRRLALARAIEIETILLDKGLEQKRIFLRPLPQNIDTPQNSVSLCVKRD